MIGQSGKGKSHLKYAIVKILPNELYEVFTSASPRSLFYYVKEYGEDSLDGVLLFIDEVESATQTLPMLRSLTSQTEITPRHASVHEAELLDLKTRGSRTIWFTSVKPFGSEQIRNRFIFPNPDETENQDERVFELQDKLNRQNHSIPEEPFKVCKKIVQKVVKETIDTEVVVPYGIDWKFKERRWLYPIFLAFIKMSAKLSFKTRARDSEGRIIATREDFERTKQIWKEFHETITYRVPRQAVQLLESIPEKKDAAKTHSELAEASSFSTRWIEKLCEDLHNEGLADRQKRSDHGPDRSAWEYWKANVPSIEDVAIIEDSGTNELTKSAPESNILSNTQFDNSEIREQLQKLRYKPKKSTGFSAPMEGPSTVEAPLDTPHMKEWEGTEPTHTKKLDFSDVKYIKLLRYPYQGFCDYCEKGMEGQRDKPVIRWECETHRSGMYYLCEDCGQLVQNHLRGEA